MISSRQQINSMQLLIKLSYFAASAERKGISGLLTVLAAISWMNRRPRAKARSIIYQVASCLENNANDKNS
jgi:hypothetical protein